MLGIYLTEDLNWNLNCQEMIKKAYSRIPLLTKLKYVGMKTEDLLSIYTLFIRSCLEYCSVVFHSSLTTQQSEMLERAQRVCLRVLLGEMFIDYKSSLEMCSLNTLSALRERQCAVFGLKALKHPTHKQLFSISKQYYQNTHNIRNPEKYHVNFAHGTK